MQVKKQQLEPDKEQQTGSKLGKEYVKAVYCQLSSDQAVKNADQRGDTWTTVLLSETLYPKFQLLFHVYI